MTAPYFLIDPLFEINEAPFTPLISSLGPQSGENAPLRHNTLIVDLDGRADALLNWKEPRLEALRAISQGLKIFWKIDLGLFSKLYAPLSDQTQYMTLTLSLNHFCESLWEEFQQHTIGLCLYDGPIDFRKTYRWDANQENNLQLWLKRFFGDIALFNMIYDRSESDFKDLSSHALQGNTSTEQLLSLFCFDSSVEYIHLLAEKLPGSLIPALLLDTESVKDEVLLMKLLTREGLEGIAKFVTDGILPAHLFSQNEFYGAISADFAELTERMAMKKSPLGFCLPTALQEAHGVDKTTIKLLQTTLKNLPSFRFLQEKTLTSTWDGLDEMVVFPSMMTKQGQRKLQGFLAAGGRITILE